MLLILWRCLQTMDELDSIPTIKELSSVIDYFSSDIAPGADNIPLIRSRYIQIHSGETILWNSLPMLAGRGSRTRLYTKIKKNKLTATIPGIFFLNILGKIFGLLYLFHSSQPNFQKKSCVGKILKTKCHCNSNPPRRLYNKRVNKGLNEFIFKLC